MYNKGFSIIELSVVLAVLSLIAGSALSIVASRIENSRLRTTQEHMSKIMEAITSYTAEYNYLPCPSDNSLTLNDADFGNGDGTNNASMTFCDAENQRLDLGVAMTEGDDIVAGGVPTQQLGLAPRFSLDGWNRRFTYIVYEPLTHAGTGGWPNTYATHLDYDNNTAIYIWSDESLIVTMANFITDDAAMVLISHGNNAHGAWKGKGGSQINKAASAGANELENAEPLGVMASFDENFVQDLATSGFDDLIQYRLKWQLE